MKCIVANKLTRYGYRWGGRRYSANNQKIYCSASMYLTLRFPVPAQANKEVDVMFKLLTTLAMALFLVGCSSGPHTPNDAHSLPPPGARQLSGAEIEQTLIGRKLTSVTATGHDFWETLNRDGTAKIQIASDKVEKGHWKVAGDVICVNYEKYGEECSTAHSDGVSVWLVDHTKKTTNNKFTVH